MDAHRLFPTLSIIIPSYNQPGKFVTEAFQSICCQEEGTYEIIFVDGGSGPETLAAAEPYRSRCSHFISEPDRGQADAINKGLKLARGELVTWLNTDDFFEPEAFRHIIEAWSKNPAAPFYMGIGFRTDEEGINRTPFYPQNFRFDRDAYMYGLNYILQPPTVFRRAALQAVGGQLDASLHYVMDSELWFRLLTLGNPVWVPHPVACSREYASTKTATGGWARFFEIQKIAARSSQAELTPGVLAELARLLSESLDDENVRRLFPEDADQTFKAVWSCAGQGLRKLCGRGDGFPVEK